MRIGRVIAICSLGWTLWVTSACDHKEATANEPQPVAQLKVYERARWRLAPEKLERVLLRVSHIAVRHARSLDQESRLRSPDWQPDAKATRTREQAIAIAHQAAIAAQASPEQFAEIARKYSDDTVTSPWGGSLGVVPASRLPTQFLDAIATLQPGQVSAPFATDYGIHVIKLEETPPEQTIAASRIVIAHDRCAIAILRPGHTRQRSRAEALALAKRISEEARKPGADFKQLIERYTDSPDGVEQAGDLGVWSTYDPSIRSLVLEALSRVAIGEVTDPVENHEGVQVLLRTPAEPRERFAAEYVVVSQMNDRPRDAMREDMDKIVAAVQAKSEEFDAYRRTLCCAEPRVWTSGRGLGAEAENVLRQLQIGEIAPAPVETAAGLYLMKRLLPPPDETRAAFTRLPAPDAPDLDGLVRSTGGPLLAHNLRLIGQQISVLPIAESKREQLSTLVADVSAALARGSAQERSALLTRFWSRSAEILSPPEVEQLRASVLQFTAGYLMSI